MNAKFCWEFFKARVVKTVGNNAYELEDLQGVYHAKNVRASKSKQMQKNNVTNSK